jgi:hypothetical protein
MAKLKCPLCGAFTAPTPCAFEAQVVLTGGQFSLDLDSFEYRQGQARAITSEEIGQPTYGIMNCQACGGRFVAKKHYSEGWQAVYPIQYKIVSQDVPEPIRSEFDEANLCFTIGAYRACTSMCGIALEAMLREQSVAGLKELKDKGIISERLYRQADQVRLWANVAKHELINEAVTSEEAKQLLLYLEQVFHEVYIAEKQLSNLTEKLKQIKKGKS